MKLRVQESLYSRWQIQESLYQAVGARVSDVSLYMYDRQLIQESLYEAAGAGVSI